MNETICWYSKNETKRSTCKNRLSYADFAPFPDRLLRTKSTGESGVLKGKISIGPICPVETVPPLPQCQPTAETYKAWQTSVWNQKKTRIIADIEPELDGTFQLKLYAGKYIVDFKNSQTNRIGANNLPIEITISSADTTTVNIDIDTGIR